MHATESHSSTDDELELWQELSKDDGPRFAFEAGDVSAASQKDILRFSDGEEDQDASFIAATQTAVNRRSESKASRKAGAFQTMGLNANLLKAINRKGFTTPTPIQRKAIPLIMDGQDVVGMARTGSGKTAAFVVPMIEKLKGHSAKVGARAIILSPSRELALQTLKVVKEFSKGTDLRTTLLVGGDSLEEQFTSVASNPDIIVATPGRFEHLKVEMGLDLSSVKYVVFDEADRLFEMGFAGQLNEIMHSLPVSRQTLLFSATLPRSLVEFARAGLQDPKLVRLDADSKISPDLQSAFFTVKKTDKDGALIYILQDVIQMPTGSPQIARVTKSQDASTGKKRKRGADGPPANELPSPHSTVVFAATKHHVEYLAALLKHFGYATSYVYGSLDQTARKMQVHDFRTGVTNILVVTDVAARGLDIPVLANVINYDFPTRPKVFVHRVGRTARAGKPGWSYNLVSSADMPYLLDLQLFLSREMILSRERYEFNMFKDHIVLGAMKPDKLDAYCEEMTKLLDEDADLAAMREVSNKGEMQYLRSRNAASVESVKRAKKLADDGSMKRISVLFENGDDRAMEKEQERLNMLARVSGFRPQETVFEIGRRGDKNNDMADVVRKRRLEIQKRQDRRSELAGADSCNLPTSEELAKSLAVTAGKHLAEADGTDDGTEDELQLSQPHGVDMDEVSESELELTFIAPAEDSIFNRATSRNQASSKSWRDSKHFMSYTPNSVNLAENRGYSVHQDKDTHFLEAAKTVTMDLTNDESASFKETSKSGMRWDKRHKKYVNRANDEDGSRGNNKFIRSESGQKIAASFKSGRFDAWRKANRIQSLPRVGEQERSNAHYGTTPGKRFKHKQERAPKVADKYRDDYHARKKKMAEAEEKRTGHLAKGKGKREVRSADEVRKVRKLKEKRKAKNARPSRKKP